MFKEKILSILVLCVGLFLFSASNSYSANETIVGYPYFMGEGRIEHATVVVSPDNLKGLLFIGELTEVTPEFKQCFQKGIDRGLEVVITGTIVPYDSPYFKKKLVFNSKTICTTR